MQRILDQNDNLVGVYDNFRHDALICADLLSQWDAIRSALPTNTGLCPSYYGLDYLKQLADKCVYNPVFYRVEL
jgi:hypothetical protein